MEDPLNPTREEIWEWAYSDAPWPEQDFDLFVTEIENADLLLTLAADLACPRRRFFLHCLYLLVGDAVRTSGRRHGLEKLRVLLGQAETLSAPVIQRWVAQSRQLISDPLAFEYEAWCGGRLAKESLQAEVQ